jgi:hypothetical protein
VHTHTEDIRRQLRRSLECFVVVPFTEGNAITVLRNGDEIFPAIADVRQALAAMAAGYSSAAVTMGT